MAKIKDPIKAEFAEAVHRLRKYPDRKKREHAMIYFCGIADFALHESLFPAANDKKRKEAPT